MEKYFVIFSHIDNKATVTFNQAEIFNKYFDGDPLLNEEQGAVELVLPVDMSAFPVGLVISGYNGHYALPSMQHADNPFHFEYMIVKRTYNDAGNITNEILYVNKNIGGNGAADALVYSQKYKISKGLTTAAISITVDI